jgi:hypothetical protein
LVLCTGTGFRALRQPGANRKTYEDYDEIIITRTCREVGELTYGHDLIEGLKTDELLNEVRRVLRKSNTTRPPPANTAPRWAGSPI